MRAVVRPLGNSRPSVKPVLAPPTNLLAWKCPDAPASLGELGAELWVQVWTFGKDAYHPASDLMVIERYCQLHEMRSAALVALGTNYITLGSTGQERINPLVTMAKDTAAELHKLETVLGLNPESRVRLGMASVEAENAFDVFKKRKEAAQSEVIDMGNASLTHNEK